ncbi:hypothetical protein [Stenotrophomonas mori]|uniref:Uncharacterized protein n=1 Tax=Stenotrophomonas mori TaxID=2871096 RepID=A0ABT0SJC2_9GAMM|nr:hypothetical protein [Stenotrophomonas mori]MCL7715406.1 hypothetical protein [Stenotrophomonas mori]
MQPRKTALAHAALQAHRGPLDLRQRRALILCDGQRGLAELTVLLGHDAAALLARLQRDGYLHAGQPPVPPPPATPPAAAPRRSLVAARIYLLDMLALQRAPAATQLRERLQATRGEADTLYALRLVLAQLPAMTSGGYVQRVRERLREVLPEAHLAAVLESPRPA